MLHKKDIRNIIIWAVSLLIFIVSNIYNISFLQTAVTGVYGTVFALGIVIMGILLKNVINMDDDILSELEKQIKEKGTDRYIMNNSKKALSYTFTGITVITFIYFNYPVLLVLYSITSIESYYLTYIMEELSKNVEV